MHLNRIGFRSSSLLLCLFCPHPPSPDSFRGPSTLRTTAIQIPPHDSSTALASTVSLPAVTQPAEPEPRISHSSTTAHSAASQRSPTTPGGDPVPGNVQPDISRRHSRWGWTLQHPVAVIVVLIVLVLVIVMIFMLNSDVQLSNYPQNKSGVSPSTDGLNFSYGTRLLSVHG